MKPYTIFLVRFEGKYAPFSQEIINFINECEVINNYIDIIMMINIIQDQE